MKKNLARFILYKHTHFFPHASEDQILFC